MIVKDNYLAIFLHQPMKRVVLFIFIPLLLLISPLKLFAAEQEVNFSAVEVNRGAYLFGRYCTLCHGTDGLGEGVLTIRIDNYPSTNLIAGEQRFNNQKELVDVIKNGGINKSLEVSESMPPYQDEISQSDIGYLATFIRYLREHTEPATEVLKGNIALLPLRRDAGKELFKIHCVLCHGKKAFGDGRMAKLFKLKKAATPANLTVSVLPKSELFKIIALGGEANARSPYMPPWSQQLSERQIMAVVEYVQSLNVKHSQ
jgi:mono/diheme cytochrome c family protein